MITLTDVWFEYPGGGKALSNASVSFAEGHITAIVGPNGAGKSTLAKLIMGLLLPKGGSVQIDGLETRIADPAQVRRLVSLAWQNPDNQLVCGVVEDDVAFGPENLGLPVPEIERRIEETLSRLGLERFRTASIHQLSSAQKQVVAVAGAMAIEPRYLILDEVTARLDPAAAHELLDAVRGWARDHETGVIMITHQLSELMRADSVCRLEKVASGGGTIASQGPPDRILGDAKFSDDVALVTPLYDTVFHLREHGVRLAAIPETVDQLVELLVQ